MREQIELEGQVFGDLTVLRYAGWKKWVCRCACGREVEKAGQSLREGRARNCSRTYHAKRLYNRFPAEYSAWKWAKRQGLVEEWDRSFEAFLEGVGHKPDERSILRRRDRTAPMGPENYEWAPHRNAPRD